MCSHPIEHDAHELRATWRSSAISSAPSADAPSNRAAEKFRVGSVEIALNASRFAIVPSSRYFAVAAPNERSRSSFGGREHPGGIGRPHLRARAHEDRLAPLGPHHGSEPAPAGVASVVRDRRVAHAALPGRADRRDPPGRTVTFPQAVLCLSRRQPPQIVGRLDPDLAAIDHDHRRLLAGSAQHDRVVAGELAGDREVARRERVGQAAGERRLGHDRELRARGQRRADQRREHEHQRRLRVERLDARRAVLVHQPRTKAGATDVRAQHRLLDRRRLARARAQVHEQRLPEIPAGWHARC